MTSFPKFAILGLTFGTLLAGVAAFAFTAPTSGPPGGIVATPLHTGTEGQAKLGGLILNTSGGALNGLIVPFGKVGIGATVPTARLDVQGTSTAVYDGTANFGEHDATLRVANVDPLNTAESYSQIVFGTRNGGASMNRIVSISKGSGTADLAFSFTQGNLVNAERMRITSGGNVGIGTAVPGHKLDILGDVRWSGTLQGGAVPWTRLSTFPGSCPAGQFVSSVGGTLTCSVPSGTGLTSETDPTVPASVKDGVSWGELSAFPAGCPAGNFVSAVGGSLTCSVPSGAGDNLGNHTATQNLNMNGFSLFNGGNIEGGDKFTIRDKGGDQPMVEFRTTDGTLDGYILYKPSADVMHFATGATQRMFLAGGDLGIGVFPQQNLSVSGGLNVNQNNSNNGSVQPGISFGWGSGEGVASKRTAGGNQWGLDFYTAFVNRMSIRQNGNIGIGTEGSPGAKLEVHQDSSGTFAGPGTAILRLANMNTTANNWVLLEFLAQKADGTQGRPAYIGAQIVDRSGGFPAADLVFGASRGVFGTAEEQMRITKNGLVGIGTASPGQKLTVAGVIESTSGGFKFPNGTIQTTAAGAGGSLWAASGANISNTNTGNVGIGTANPQWPLDVNGDINAGGKDLFLGGAQRISDSISASYTNLRPQAGNLTLGNNGVSNRIDIYNSDSSRLLSLIQDSIATKISSAGTGNHLAFYTQPPAGGDPLERMRINDAGNVGIGTASPGQKLTVAGVIESTSGGVKFPDGTMQTTAAGAGGITGSGTINTVAKFTGASAIGNSQIFDNGTSVGIGTASPLEKLSVEGNIRLDGTLSAVGGYSEIAFTRAAGDWSPVKIRQSFRGGWGGDLSFWTTITDSNTLTEKMRIGPDGSVGIGVKFPAFKLEVAGSVGADSYFYRSDVTLKKDIEKLENVLAKISKIQGTKFRFESERAKRIGLIAQEVEKTFPELVRTNANGIKSIDLGGLSAITVEAIKEQETKIEALQKEIEEIKIRLEKLEGN